MATSSGSGKAIVRWEPEALPAWSGLRGRGWRGVSWPALAMTVLLAGSTYLLRSVLTRVGLQGLTFIIPTLVAAFCFGSVLASTASVLTLALVHLIAWREN